MPEKKRENRKPKPTRRKSDEIRAEMRDKVEELSKLTAAYKQQEKDLQVKLKAATIETNQTTLDAIKKPTADKQRAVASAKEVCDRSIKDLRKYRDRAIEDIKKHCEAEVKKCEELRDEMVDQTLDDFSKTANNLERERIRKLKEVNEANEVELLEFYNEREKALGSIRAAIDDLQEQLFPTSKPKPNPQKAATPKAEAQA